MNNDVGIWMPLYIGDMLAKVTRLTTEQVGAANLLMWDYWKNGSIPDDNQTVANITRLSVAKVKGLKQVLINAGLFVIADGMITSTYLDDLKTQATDNKASKSDKAKKAAEVRWGNERKTKELAEQQALHEHHSSNAHAMPEHMQNECLGIAQDMLGGCPSPSPSSNNNNPPQGASADTREKMLVDTFAPNLADVNVRLKSSGHKEIDATLMLKELARFKDEYSKNSIAYPENWYLGRVSSWIMSNYPSRQPGKSLKNNQPRPSQQPTRNVNDAWPDIPEHAPAVDNTELPEDFV